MAGSEVLTPSPAARFAALTRGATLDRALILGADPSASPSLAARAQRLTSRRYRRDLAGGVERALDSREETGLHSRVRPAAAAIRACRAQLRAVADLLAGDTPVYAPGVARVRALLRDGAGPLYTDRCGEALEAALRAVRAALAGADPEPVSS